MTEIKYNFKEAFALMYYENEKTKMGFLVWNSRDGVSPFIVMEDGVEYQHAHWGLDERVTNQDYIKKHILVPGQRIFRNITEEEARAAAIRRLQSAKGTRFEVEENSERWHELIASLTKDFVGEGLDLQPTMVKVKDDGTY